MSAWGNGWGSPEGRLSETMDFDPNNGGSEDGSGEMRNSVDLHGLMIAPALDPHLDLQHDLPEGAFGTRLTFYVGASGPEVSATTRQAARMYVEQLDPLLVVQPLPVILIHGDWHTGQVWMTKPDGDAGWASYLNYRGYRVLVVDLPGCGRSNFLTASQVQTRDQSAVPDPRLVARDVTATASQTTQGWNTALLHNQWPGTGQPGDDIFERYYTSLVPMLLRKTDRQRLAQMALGNLLEHTGPAVLLGEGTGATMAWLAADLQPDLVLGVIAVEPAGPPCGTARDPDAGHAGGRRFTSQIRFDPHLRPYGLADIPLRYEPPAEPAAHVGPKLDVLPSTGPSGTCMLQRTTEPRRLVNLQRMPHVIITAQASSHSTFDWATRLFLEQAGVPVNRMVLEQAGIFGNGHLMFLERNSNEVASLVVAWIMTFVQGEWGGLGG